MGHSGGNWQGTAAQQAAVKKAALASAAKRRGHGKSSHDSKLSAIAQAFQGTSRSNPITMNEVTSRLHDQTGGKGDGDMGPFQDSKEARRMVLELDQHGVLKSKYDNSIRSYVYWLPRTRKS